MRLPGMQAEILVVRPGISPDNLPDMFFRAASDDGVHRSGDREKPEQLRVCHERRETREGEQADWDNAGFAYSDA